VLALILRVQDSSTTNHRMVDLHRDLSLQDQSVPQHSRIRSTLSAAPLFDVRSPRARTVTTRELLARESRTPYAKVVSLLLATAGKFTSVLQ